MWNLCIEDDQSNRTVIDLARTEYDIGRAEQNAIRLTERNISRRHARIWSEGDSWYIEDCGSATGTFRNGMEVRTAVALAKGDQLRLGDYSLWLTDGTEAAVPAPRAHETTRVGPRSRRDLRSRDRLVVVEGPGAGYQYPLGPERLLVGRGEECDIALADTSVSRVHIDIERMPGGSYRVEDQDSSNGLRINGHEVASATLAPGDLLELGDVLLTFVPSGQDFDPKRFQGRIQAPGLGAVLLGTLKDPKVLLAALGAGIALGGVLFWLTDNTRQPAASQSARSPSALALDRATDLHSQGDLEGAHETLATIAPGSNVRASERFKLIEADWADQAFARATATSDLSEKRRLLQAIEKCSGLDQGRRREAAEALTRLAKQELAPRDLPRAGSDPRRHNPSPLRDAQSDDDSEEQHSSARPSIDESDDE